MLIPIITFVAVLAIVFGAYWFVVGQPETTEQEKLRRRIKAEAPVRLQKQVRVGLLKEQQGLSTIHLFDSVLSQSGALTRGVRGLIDASGLKLTVASFLMLTAISALVGALVAGIYIGVLWVTLPVAAVAAMLPHFVLSTFKQRRIGKFEEQFPEAIELISRSMRAGHAFATGIKMAADELPAPAGPEFKMLYERQNFGAQMPDALRSFAERVPTIDARFFVTAVLTQREAGGNLAEILDRLAGVMRERFRIRREVQTRSAHGRMTAYVLAAMPPGLAFMMVFVNPAQMRVLVTDPMGIRIIIGAVVLQVIGTLLVRKIVDIQY